MNSLLDKMIVGAVGMCLVRLANNLLEVFPESSASLLAAQIVGGVVLLSAVMSVVKK